MSDSEESTYVEPEFRPGDLNAIDDACLAVFFAPCEAPWLFSRAGLFNGAKKRLSDTDRVEETYDTSTGMETNTGTTVQELTAELKRKKLRP